MPTDVNMYTSNNCVIDNVPPLLKKYKRTYGKDYNADGWLKRCDYDISLFVPLLNDINYSRTLYECSYVWNSNRSYGSPLSSGDYGLMNKVGQSVNGVKGLTYNNNDCASRELRNDVCASCVWKYGSAAFSHPQIKLK